MPDNWGYYATLGDIYYYPTTNPQITHIDNVTTHEGHLSIRIDAPATEYNTAREVNWIKADGTTSQIPVEAGDTVTFGMWIKTEASSVEGETRAAIFGFDMYHDSQRVWEVALGYQQDWFNDAGFSHYLEYVWVAPDTDWIYKELIITIPTTIYTEDDYGNPIASGQINYITPWLTGRWQIPTETGSVWFADATLTLNDNPATLPADTTTALYGGTWSSNILLLGTITIGAGLVYKLTERWHQY